MTDPNYTAICLLVDRSGSMHTIKEDAQGGVNDFLASQRAAPGRRTVRIDLFDHRFDVFCPSTPAAAVPEFELIPRGATALLDAMGRSITAFGEELAALDATQRPGAVVFAVMTDGHENDSTEYTWETVQTMVRTQEDQYGWQIMYLGANQDAITVGQRLGVDPDRALTYTATAAGTQAGAAVLDWAANEASRGAAVSFTAEQRRAATQP